MVSAEVAGYLVALLTFLIILGSVLLGIQASIKEEDEESKQKKDTFIGVGSSSIVLGFLILGYIVKIPVV